DIFFYSITIDPEHDTPAVLKDYAAKYHVAPGWTFLTGSAADIELISKKLGLYSAPNPDNPDGHTPSLLVGNEPTGQWMRNSALDTPAFLARTMSDWLDGWKDNATKPMPSFAEVPLLAIDAGEYTFRNHCVACHSIGGGDAIGPDLKGVTARRDHAWLQRFIVRPDQVRADNDPLARMLEEKYAGVRMPNLALSDQDAAVLIDYITRASTGSTQPAAATKAPMTPMPGMPDPQPLAAKSRPGVVGRDVEKTKAAVNGMFEAYLHIQQALADDRMHTVGKDSLALANATVAIGSPAANVRVAVNPFAQAGDLRAARDAFGGLSDALIGFAGDTMPAGLAVAYCPMAKKDWLQRRETIQNPSYGKAMAECGRIVRH